MLKRLFGGGGKEVGNQAGWALAASLSGDLLLALPEGIGQVTTPVVTVDADGALKVTGAARRGRAITLADHEALQAVAASQSVIVAVPSKGMLLLSAAPVIRKDQKPQLSFARGKVHRVTVERVVDDGAVTGVWRGYVRLHAGIPDVFAELAPPFPIAVGSRIRIVGAMDPTGPGADGTVRMRFRSGAWVPLADRGLLFSAGGSVRLESSANADGREAWRSMEAALAELSLMRQRETGTKIPLPMVRVPMAGSETAAQRGMRLRLQAANAGIVRQGAGRGRRMKIAATEWHGAVRKNGDIVLEIRREPFAEPPLRTTVIVNSAFVTTIDGLPSRIGLRCVFRDGTVTTMLLGGGPQEIASEIARRRSIVVVQGMPGAETYAEVHVSVADVQKQ